MIHRIFSHGAKGDPVSYLLKERDPPAEVVRGDPKLWSKANLACPFSRRYTSWVLSFEESIPEDIQNEIIDSYEATAFAGLDATDIAILWVRHSENHRTELHGVVVNMHLSSMKNYKHYWKGLDFHLFDSWQELVNYKYGLSSPHDPRRARLRDRPPNNYSPQNKIDYYKIDDSVCREILQGRVKTRADIISFLENEGFEVGENKGYLGVRKKGAGGKRIRLNGRKYNPDTDIPEMLQPAPDFTGTWKSEDEYQTIFNREILERALRNIQKHPRTTEVKFEPMDLKPDKEANYEREEKRKIDDEKRNNEPDRGGLENLYSRLQKALQRTRQSLQHIRGAKQRPSRNETERDGPDSGLRGRIRKLRKSLQKSLGRIRFRVKAKAIVEYEVDLLRSIGHDRDNDYFWRRRRNKKDTNFSREDRGAREESNSLDPDF